MYKLVKTDEKKNKKLFQILIVTDELSLGWNGCRAGQYACF